MDGQDDADGSEPSADRRAKLARIEGQVGDAAAQASAAAAELRRARAVWRSEGWAARARLRAAHAQAVRCARVLAVLRAKLAEARTCRPASG